MKWFFLFFLRGLAMFGPYESEQECIVALKIAIDQPVMDQGFDGARAAGVCFQGVQPKSKD